MGYSTATEQLKEEKRELKAFRLATVSALFNDGCPKVRFMGEETDSEKKYKIIDDSSYTIGDTVLVGIINDNYVILGSIGYDPDSGGGATVYLTEEQANLLYATKTHTHSEYSLTSHFHNKIQTAGGFSLDIVVLSGSGYSFRASTDNNCDIGTATNRMRTIYAGTSAISTSDENQKHDIEPLDERYEKFIKSIKPRRYKFNDGTSNRYHTGFIAQDVKRAMDEANISDKEFGGYVQTPKFNKCGKKLKTFDYGLRYEEFIAPNTMMIQRLFGMAEELFNIAEQQSEQINKQSEQIKQLERRLDSGANL